MNRKVKKLILTNIPYVFFGLVGTKLGETFRLAPGTDFAGKLRQILEGLNAAFQSPLPSFHPFDLLIGAAVGGALRLAVCVKGKNAKKFRKDTEYGSARWGNPEDIAPYTDPDPRNNVILTATESLTMNNRPKDPKTARNKNVLVIGGSGSGKTRFFLKPNLMQCDSEKYPCSFVVTDPKGSLIVECGQALQRNGYTVYGLGDMFLRCEDAECILKRLKGRKRLIVGNHDGSWMTKVPVKEYFESVDTMLETSVANYPAGKRCSGFLGG